MKLQILFDIQEQAARIRLEDLRVPQGTILAADTAVGTITEPDLQRLFTLAFNLEHEASLAVVQGFYTPDSSELPTIQRRIGELAEKSEFAMNLFWVELRQRFNLWRDPMIGVRQNWTVVTTDQDKLRREVTSEAVKAMGALFSSMVQPR